MIDVDAGTIEEMIAQVVSAATKDLSRYCQKSNLIGEIAATISRVAVREGWNPGAARYYMTDALEWLDSLHAAANPLYRSQLYRKYDTAATAQSPKAPEIDSKTAKHAEEWLWDRPSLASAAVGGPTVQLDMSALSECAAMYLKKPWGEIPSIEIMMVEMLAYAECLAFGEHIAGLSGALGKRAKAAWTFVRDSAQILAVVYVTVQAWERYGAWAGMLAGAAMFYFVASFPSPFGHLRRKNIQLLSDMASVYQVLGHRPVCPGLIRERIYATSNAGAVWPSGMPSLVERAAVRNSAQWI